MDDQPKNHDAEAHPTAMPPGTRGAAALKWAPLIAAVLCLAVAYALGLHRYLSLDALRSYQGSLSAFVEANPLMAPAAYLLVYTLAVAVSFPGASFLTIAGGLMFGSLVGAPLAVVAATLGATLVFLIARTSLGDFLAARAGPRTQRLRQGFREEGFSYLLFLRLVPLFPFWLVNIAAALFGMRLLPYVAATAIGILPATFVFAYFGEGVGTALESDGPPASLGLFVGLALLGVMALIPVVVRRWRRGKERGAAS